MTTQADVLTKLQNDHKRFGNWQKVGDLYGVNKRYPWEFATKGIVPPSQDVRIRLGLEVPSVGWWDVEL